MTNLNALKKMSIVTALAALMTGCSGGGGSGSDAQTNIVKTDSCSVASKAGHDPEELEIESAPAAKPGDQVKYSLNKDMACAKNESVAWRSVAGGTRLKTGDDATFVSSFRKPGEYVVAAAINTAGSPDTVEVSTKTVIDDGVALVGPHYGMALQEHHFELAVPAGITLASAVWNFGDGTPTVSGLTVPDHTYMSPGNFTVSVALRDTNGVTGTLTHNIQVIPPSDGLECIRELSTSGPTQATVGLPINVSVYIPQCISWRIVLVRWNFGDGSQVNGGQNVQHTYNTPGTVTVTVDLYQRNQLAEPFLTLTRQIEVLPVTGEEEPEEPEVPGPVDPLACPTVGNTRESNGDMYSEEVACGIGGSRTITYRDRITQTCLMTGERMHWTETGRQREKLNEGECMGQACELPAQALTGVDVVALNLLHIGGKYYLPHGSSKTFYSTQSPAGACSTVAQTRTCDNGAIGGSTNYTFLLCNDGCPGVGQHGTIQTGVITGEATVPKQCAFGETGINDIFHVLSDKTCDRGTVKTSNTRTGGIKTAGLCPGYEWFGTENFSQCDANCGGKQSRLFVCRDASTKQIVGNERCPGVAPTEERVCDGNPEAVRRSDVSTVTEDAGSSTTCPANQIGIITRKRDATTTKVYACINHAVGLESENTTYSPWVEERHCRDYVAHRCSNDSIDNTQASGRYLWMLKCRSQLPAVDQFLTDFKNTPGTIMGTKTMTFNKKIVYGTFLDRSKNPEKTWKAPTSESAACAMPESVYVASVCVASCATPEQQIMVELEKGQLGYTTFLNAWQEDIKKVATLMSNSSMSSKQVQKTEVDQWVTELLDGEHDVIKFTMKSGRVLKLTPNHPLVTDQGMMKDAVDFKAGDNLVMLGGLFDAIVSAEQVKHFGKVYNVFVKSDAIHKNIVVTNGYLNGTAYFQNEGAKHMNRKLLRGALTNGVFSK